MAQENSYIEKQFGFSEVTWTVKNSCVAPQNSYVEFYSPEFHVRGPHLTKWRMILKRYFIKNASYAVEFFLQRLNCNSFYDMAKVDCVLMYTDRQMDTVEIDFKHDFGINLMTIYSHFLVHAGGTPVNNHHSADFRIKCQILVHFLDMPDTPLCQNPGLRRLSDDMFYIYEEGIMSNMHIYYSKRQTPMKVHRPILFNRLTQEKLKIKIKAECEDEHLKMDLSDFLFEPSEKVIRFLYSGNTKFIASNKDLPSINTYIFAKFLDVKPVISYYDPDTILLTTETKVEEYFATWTIENFCNRNETFLQSPQMTDKTLDTDWRLKVYPKGINGKGGYVYVRLDIHARIKRAICVELFLKNDRESSVYRSYHRTVFGPEAFIERNFISLDNVRNNYSKDDSLTIGLRLRISTDEESNFIDESIANYRNIYEQKYYERLSEDISSLYKNETMSDMCIDFKEHNFKILAHECILHMRCPDLLYDLKKFNLNYFNGIKHVVIAELFSFLYSGKLGKHLSLDDKFCLYRTANKFNFFSLKSVIEEELKNSLSECNARNIFEFADSESIESLRDSAESLITGLERLI